MSLPDNDRTVDPAGKLTAPWLKWASDVDKLVTAAKLSGTTANRPVDYLFIGRQYFDTDLGKPVFLKDVGPAQWVDAMGVPA